MVLGIISDCVHIRKKDGMVGSQVHVFVNQMDHLSAHFDKVYMCAPVIKREELDSKISIYTNKHIEFLPIPLAGGNSI